MVAKRTSVTGRSVSSGRASAGGDSQGPSAPRSSGVKGRKKAAAKPTSKKSASKPRKKAAAKPTSKKSASKPGKKAAAKPTSKKSASKPRKKAAAKARRSAIA
ncbi:MAG: hypothetical protein WCQ52_08500 [Actinomycetes bacterium]